ncbi:MAG: hypothetical protein ACI8W8_004658 [Rhodothermales bacterium]|jgi:hypothetical protein
MAVAGINIRGIVSEILDDFEDALPEGDLALPQIFAEFAEEAAESELVYDDGFDPRLLQTGQRMLDGPPGQLPLLLQTCLRLRRRLQEPDLQRAGHDVRLYRLRLALDGLFTHGVADKPKLRERQIVDILIQIAGITDRGMWTSLTETLEVVDDQLNRSGMTNQLGSALQSLRSEMGGARSPRERNLRRRIREMLAKDWPAAEVKTLRIVTPPTPTNVDPPQAPDSRRVRQAEELLITLGPKQAQRIVRSAFDAASRTPAALSAPRQAELLMDYVVICGLPDAPPMLEWVADLAAVLSGVATNTGIEGVIETCLFVLTKPTDGASASLERLAAASLDDALRRRARSLLQLAY